MNKLHYFDWFISNFSVPYIDKMVDDGCPYLTRRLQIIHQGDDDEIETQPSSHHVKDAKAIQKILETNRTLFHQTSPSSEDNEVILHPLE